MSDTVRFGVSIDADLLSKFDDLIEEKGFENRSEAIRSLIRDGLVEQEWKSNEEIVGVVVLLFNHHKRNLSEQLNDLQHDKHSLVMATTHLHLDKHNCLEMIAVKGAGKEVEKLASSLIGRKGVKHGKLTVTSTGEFL